MKRLTWYKNPTPVLTRPRNTKRVLLTAGERSIYRGLWALKQAVLCVRHEYSGG